MNDFEKINFLINSCQKHHQRFPHILVVTEDFSACEAFALDISSKLARDMVTVNAAMIYKVGDLAGVVTNLKVNDFLLIEDINLLNKECLYYFTGILENFRLDLMIDSGPSARSVEVKLHEFTVIGSVAKIHLMPRKLVSSFFCIIEGEETRKITMETIHKILNEESIDTSDEAAEYIFSLTDSNKIEIKLFLRNLISFLKLSGFQKNYALTCDIIDEYFNFFGISNFKKENLPSRQILADVQREVWRRDQGRCVMCQSQAYLELDHIIPFSKGGSNTARNIQLLCEICNRKKGAKI